MVIHLKADNAREPRTRLLRISATLLTAEEVCIKNIPDILDVKKPYSVVEDIGVKVSRITPSDYIFKADDVNLEYLQSDDFIQKCSHLREVFY